MLPAAKDYEIYRIRRKRIRVLSCVLMRLHLFIRLILGKLEELEERLGQTVFPTQRFPFFGIGMILRILRGISNNIADFLNIGCPGHRLIRVEIFRLLFGFPDGIDAAGLKVLG